MIMTLFQKVNLIFSQNMLKLKKIDKEKYFAWKLLLKMLD